MLPLPFFLQLLINGLLMSLTYILFALGLTLIFGIMDIINFAHSEFFMLGAFCAFFFYSEFGVNYFLALAISMPLVGALGIICEKLLFHRLRREVILSFIVALGLGMVLQSSTQMGFGVEDKVVAAPFRYEWTVFGARLALQRLVPALVGGALAVALLLFMSYFKHGKMLRAVAQDMDAAVLQGISISQARVLAWFIGCALAAAAGVLVSPLICLNAYIGQEPLIKAFGIVIIGGFGSIPGALLGGGLLGLVEGIGATFIGSAGATLVWFGLVILTLIVRPRGLLGRG